MLLASSSSALSTLFLTVVVPLAILVVYLLPAWIAIMRKHHQTAAILLLNLLLGWTALGWIAALVWSATSTRRA